MYQKYLFQNYAMTTAYRPYNEDIPDFLRDRPHKLVVHCMDRIRKSRKFRNEDIQMEDSCGEFNVTTVSGKVHKVDFGNATGTPSCTCMDWVRYHIPCKHFFAIFNHQENWSWHSLPPAYLTSPLLSIDHKALASEFPNVTLDASETPFETMSEELITKLKPLPDRKVTWQLRLYMHIPVYTHAINTCKCLSFNFPVYRAIHRVSELFSGRFLQS